MCGPPQRHPRHQRVGPSAESHHVCPAWRTPPRAMRVTRASRAAASALSRHASGGLLPRLPPWTGSRTRRRWSRRVSGEWRDTLAAQSDLVLVPPIPDSTALPRAGRCCLSRSPPLRRLLLALLWSHGRDSSACKLPRLCRCELKRSRHNQCEDRLPLSSPPPQPQRQAHCHPVPHHEQLCFWAQHWAPPWAPLWRSALSWRSCWAATPLPVTSSAPAWPDARAPRCALRASSPAPGATRPRPTTAASMWLPSAGPSNAQLTAAAAGKSQRPAARAVAVQMLDTCRRLQARA